MQHLHEECYGGEDATCVEGVVHLILSWIRHCCVYHDPPACEELGEEKTGLSSVVIGTQDVQYCEPTVQRITNGQSLKASSHQQRRCRHVEM